MNIETRNCLHRHRNYCHQFEVSKVIEDVDVYGTAAQKLLGEMVRE